MKPVHNDTNLTQTYGALVSQASNWSALQHSWLKIPIYLWKFIHIAKRFWFYDKLPTAFI